ncbi:hypothetical protein [Comamonas sp.]|uniref:hypothetical protein n=1 Tax=Comamonas sp. TaxID=34028 RepID=UPI00258F15B5|nr:hypothetical protein [Comamonas sp.]
MNNKFLTLAELNAGLAVCEVSAQKLADMGYHPATLSKQELDAVDEATRKKWRTAKLYPASKLQDIRATIGASMRDACCELRLLGRELVNAETELPETHSIIVTVESGKTTVALHDGVAPINTQARPLHIAVRQSIQGALAEVAAAQRNAGYFHQKQ